jgi:hypothetical protein
MSNLQTPKTFDIMVTSGLSFRFTFGIHNNLFLGFRFDIASTTLLKKLVADFINGFD